jgi:ATF/CREB family transcription factor
MDRQNNFPPLQQPRQRAQNDPFANHDVSNAANDLLSFATQNGGARNGQQQAFSMPPQQPTLNAGHMPVQPISQENGHRRDTKGSVNSMTGSADTGDFSESGQSEHAKTSTRSRGKKGAANSKQAAGQKRKAEEAPKGSSRKKSMAMSMDEDMDDDDEDQDMKEETINGRKMTDEEKRKNFLERNRYVSLRSAAHHLLTPVVSLPSSVVNARSNGLPTCRPRWNFSAQRMMHFRPQSRNCVRRLSI